MSRLKKGEKNLKNCNGKNFASVVIECSNRCGYKLVWYKFDTLMNLEKMQKVQKK